MYTGVPEAPTDKAKRKIRQFAEDVWPSIYVALNDFLKGTLMFLRDTIASVFKKY